MIEDQFLNLFITEDIFQLAEKMPAQEQPTATSPAMPTATENPAATVTEAAVPKLSPPTQPLHALAIWTPPLTSKDRQLLTKILQAVNEDINKAELMEGIGKYAPNYKKLLCFGYQKELELKVGQTVSFYQPISIEGKSILTSVAPADLHDSREEKARLWSALQQMFLK